MSDKELLDSFVNRYQSLKNEIGKVIVGQDKAVDSLLLSIFTGGHCLLVGVPGLAKTLMVNTLSRALGLSFSRIQFTPDLMPSDITGSEILDENRRFQFVKGPVFANIVLADEINRTPPKTQAALLEAMQEKSVTVSGKTYPLSAPFFVLATQNPIEQEGTYPLPEAQLDRFMLNIRMDYPSFQEEVDIVKGTTANYTPQVEVILSADSPPPPVLTPPMPTARALSRSSPPSTSLGVPARALRSISSWVPRPMPPCRANTRPTLRMSKP